MTHRRSPDATLVDRLVRTTATMVDDVAALVGIDSPSSDVAAVTRCAAAVAQMGTRLLGEDPEVTRVDGRPHLRWRRGRGGSLLLGHFDTVWPLGTTDRWPFEVADGRASGPGAFDMKAGIVQAFHALATLDPAIPVTVLLTSDEEIGSPSSRRLISEAAASASAVLVLEPSELGALKTERKGISTYELQMTGRAAHAGLDPGAGINAVVELAHQVLAVSALAAAPRSDASPGHDAAGTTVTPTVAAAGTTTNTVPARASLHVDVRATSVAEQERIDLALRALRPALPDARLVVAGGIDRPPLEEVRSSALFAQAQRVAAALGLDPLASANVGGASDGNLTAAQGVPTLDGLGAVGAGAHAEGEHVVVDELPRRAALLVGLVADIGAATNCPR